MGPTQIVARHLLANGADSYAALDIATDTGLSTSQVHSALHYYAAIGAVEKMLDPGGRTRSVYRISNRSELERRTDGRARKALSEELLDEAPPLSFFIDGDGDLQLVREGEEPVLIRNADARRLVAFVATQATAILTA